MINIADVVHGFLLCGTGVLFPWQREPGRCRRRMSSTTAKYEAYCAVAVTCFVYIVQVENVLVICSKARAIKTFFSLSVVGLSSLAAAGIEMHATRDLPVFCSVPFILQTSAGDRRPTFCHVLSC